MSKRNEGRNKVLRALAWTGSLKELSSRLWKFAIAAVDVFVIVIVAIVNVAITIAVIVVVVAAIM